MRKGRWEMFALLSHWSSNNRDMSWIKGCHPHPLSTCPPQSFVLHKRFKLLSDKTPAYFFNNKKTTITPAYCPEILKPQKRLLCSTYCRPLRNLGYKKCSRAQNISSGKRAKLYSRLFFLKISPSEILFQDWSIWTLCFVPLQMVGWGEKGGMWQNTSSLSHYRGACLGGWGVVRGWGSLEEECARPILRLIWRGWQKS